MDPKWIYNREKPWDDPVNAYVVQNSSSNIFNDGRIFKCPSNPNEGNSVSFAHYVGITGVGADAAWLAIEHPHAGFFGYDRRLTDKDLNRGASNIMVVAETATKNGPWAAGGHPTS